MPSPGRPLLISVIGSSSATANSKRLAREVGKLLAEEGAVVVCGGLTGVMEAVCQGASEAGGTTIGILPGHHPSEANQYVQIPICTGMGYARNVIVVKSGRAVIAIEGAYGTLSEIAHALGDGIPVVGLETWNFSSNGKSDSGMTWASTPKDAVSKALKLARGRAPSRRRRLSTSITRAGA